MDRYILDDNRSPVRCNDLEKWGAWFETADRRVAEDTVGDARISTVFLGIDHGFGQKPPILFETMIFGGPHDQYQERCSTWAEAEEMHAKAVALVRAN